MTPQLQQQIRPVIDWYRHLARVQQIGVNAGLVLLVSGLIISALLPSHALYSQSKAEFVTARDNLQWMQTNKAAAIASRVRVKPIDAKGGSLMALSASSAQQFGLTFKRFQPDGDTRIKVWLDDVAFDALLRWMATISESPVARIDRVNLSRLVNVPGRVNAQLELVRRE